MRPVVSIWLVVAVFLMGNPRMFAQQLKPNPGTLVVRDTIARSGINPLAPTKAAFYSAILPGLGQAYNKSYWKIPIVYGALATGILIHQRNNDSYHRYRNAYKSRLAGRTDDEFYPQYSNQTLINAQRQFQRNRDLSLLITVGLYALNIVEANVDAHLKQFNVDDNLTVRPTFFPNDIDNRQNVGVKIHFSF